MSQQKRAKSVRDLFKLFSSCSIGSMCCAACVLACQSGTEHFGSLVGDAGRRNAGREIQMPLQSSFFLYVRVSFVTYGFFNDDVSD